MKIALFHYHLHPGGVTDVIVTTVRTLLSRLHNLEEIRLVTGVEKGSRPVLERIREGFNSTQAGKIRLDILEEIAYVEMGAAPDPVSLATRLEARYGEDTLWWVHNYHIGKNPSLTSALMMVAHAQSRNMLLHIHDFPECGRTENLRLLDAALPTPPYPSGDRIRYAVINERDQHILIDAGLGDSVALLNNPVPSPPPQITGNSSLLKQALFESCATDNPGFIPEAPIFLYPVRAIRRKNVLEAALLVRLLKTPANLVITLPGISAQEKPYSNKVAKAYRDGLIPGAWCPEATGDERLRYPLLTASCDAIISTSVQEGFGYLFLNAVHWRKPLLARYLDILDGILKIFGDYPRRFWADFRVPVGKEITENTLVRYRKKFAALRETLPSRAAKAMEIAIEKLVNGGGIDMSYLSVDDQLSVLKRAKNDPDWMEEIKTVNRDLLDSINRTVLATPPAKEALIKAQFGEVAFVRSFQKILDSFGEKTPKKSPEKVREVILKTFGRLDYHRLIYDQ